MAYKTVDLRGQLPGGVASNIGSQNKTPGRYVVHYSGPDYPGFDMYDQLRAGQKTVLQVLASEASSHMAPGRFDPTFTVNGLQYHVTIWKDTVYLCRDRNAKLWHCGDGTASTSYNYSATAVHVPTTKGFPVDPRTLQTLAEWITDDMKGSGATSRQNVKGHQEVGASECPGQLMTQFVHPFRAGKLNPDEKVPEEQGGGDASTIPVDGLMSRWEFGQVAVDRLTTQQTITYDGEKLWTFTPAAQPVTDYPNVMNLSRYDFVTRPIQDLPEKFEVTFSGTKFGVIEMLGEAVDGGPDYVERVFAQLLPDRGGRYTPWFSGRMGEGPCAWAANAAPPAKGVVKMRGGFCAYALNMAKRAVGQYVFRDAGGWWYGGVAWWGHRIQASGVGKPLSAERVRQGNFKPGTLFIDFYKGPALGQQGHVAILYKGETLFQSDTGLGINTSRTLQSTYANVSRFTHYVEPEDWLGPNAKI